MLVRNIITIHTSNDFVALDWFANLLFCQISNITRGQRQIMHQLDNLNNLLRESMGERNRLPRTNSSKGTDGRFEPLTVPLAVTLAVGILGVIIYKGVSNRS